jgi:hypothetical protein
VTDKKLLVDDVIERILGKRPGNPDDPILAVELNAYRAGKRADAEKMLVQAPRNSHESLVIRLAIQQMDDMAFNEICQCGKRTLPSEKFALGERVYCLACGKLCGQVGLTFKN